MKATGHATGRPASKEGSLLSPHLRSRMALGLSLVGLAGCQELRVPQMASPDMNATAARPAEVVPGLIVTRQAPGARTVQSMSIQGMSIQSLTGLPDTRVIRLPAGQDVQDVLRDLLADPGTVYAEPVYRYRALGDATSSIPDDPRLPELWGWSKIRTPEIWDRAKTGSNVRVAVVDTGVDRLHPDLANHVLPGWDCVNGDADPQDDQGHGSHVAGTIAAVAGNRLGISGIAPNTQIVPVKVLGSDGSGETTTIAQGILKARELGAQIINLSLGGPERSKVLEDAIARVTAQGCLVVVAAGNDGTTTPSHPAAFADSLSVAATDASDRRASFSQYGSTVDIAAPGVDILSTTDGDYKKHSGTSMASPHVAAAAAMLLSLHPEATPARLRQALEAGAERRTTGFGTTPVARLDLVGALAEIETPSSPTPTPAPSVNPTAAPTVPVPARPLPVPTARPVPVPTARPLPAPSARPGERAPRPGSPAPGRKDPGRRSPFPGWPIWPIWPFGTGEGV